MDGLTVRRASPLRDFSFASQAWAWAGLLGAGLVGGWLHKKEGQMQPGPNHDLETGQRRLQVGRRGDNGAGGRGHHKYLEASETDSGTAPASLQGSELLHAAAKVLLPVPLPCRHP
jgi:hypothetical protein